MKIVVLDGYTLNPGDNPWDPIQKLGDLKFYDRTSQQELVERAKDAEIVLTNKTPMPAEILAQLPKLKFISVLATGFNIVDVAAARKQGIAVSNVPVYSTDSVAQFVFALLLEMCHHIGGHDAAVHEGGWTRCKDFCFWNTPLVELAGKKFGILGFGRIGRRVGELAHAFGMEVLASSRSKGADPGYSPFRWVDVPTLFKESDVVSLHAPQTDVNKYMVNKELLGQMKKTAFLINTARGLLIQENDLAEALNAGTIAGAALDVVSAEPMKADNPLLKAKNCIITPHIAWATAAARKRLMNTTAENIAAYQSGKPVNVVN
jgi:glycerate dehydrogenase